MQNGTCNPHSDTPFASYEERLASEIACLKEALAKIDIFSDDPEHQWARGIYEKIIQRRETVLRGLTGYKSPLTAYAARRAG